MFSAPATAIFAYRNADKTQNGEIGKGPVMYGQLAGLAQEVAKYEGIVSNFVRSSISVFSDAAKHYKAFEYAGKATQFAINNVNPLICASGVVKTTMSDDKVKTGITETAALSAMFLGEGMVKRYYDDVAASKTVQNSVKNLSESSVGKPIFEYLEKHKLKGKAGAIVKGLTFVAGSMTSYSIGKELGEPIADRVKANWGLTEEKKPQKINRMT